LKFFLHRGAEPTKSSWIPGMGVRGLRLGRKKELFRYSSILILDAEIVKKSLIKVLAASKN